MVPLKDYNTLKKNADEDVLEREDYIEMANYVLRELAYIMSTSHNFNPIDFIKDCTIYQTKPPQGTWMESMSSSKIEDEKQYFKNIINYSSILLKKTPGNIITQMTFQGLVNKINEEYNKL